MMSRDLGSYLNYDAAAGVVHAALGSTPVAMHGVAHDRDAQTSLELSAVMLAAIGVDSGTSSVKFTVQDSADNSSWADYTDPSTGAIPSVTLVGASGASVQAVAKVNLSAARRYVRVNSETAGQSATSSTGLLFATLIFGGSADLPANANPAQ